MPGTSKDVYSNVLQVGVTQSATDALTFEEIDIGLTIFQKVGIIINRVEVQLGSGNMSLLSALSDRAQVAITQSNQISSVGIQETAVLFQHEYMIRTVGTAATAYIQEDPTVFDFSQMPGGGLLCTPKPLYAAVDSDALASAMSEIVFRLYFQILELKADEYFELLEARRFFGS